MNRYEFYNESYISVVPQDEGGVHIVFGIPKDKDNGISDSLRAIMIRRSHSPYPGNEPAALYSFTTVKCDDADHAKEALAILLEFLRVKKYPEPELEAATEQLSIIAPTSFQSINLVLTTALRKDLETFYPDGIKELVTSLRGANGVDGVMERLLDAEKWATPLRGLNDRLPVKNYLREIRAAAAANVNFPTPQEQFASTNNAAVTALHDGLKGSMTEQRKGKGFDAASVQILCDALRKCTAYKGKGGVEDVLYGFSEKSTYAGMINGPLVGAYRTQMKDFTPQTAPTMPRP